MTTGLLDVPWLVWSGLAAVLAAFFTVVQIPKQTPHSVGFTHLALRWFHSITWLLLALSFLLRGLAPPAPALANLVGVSGLGTYITFHIVLSRARASQKPASGQPQPAAAAAGPAKRPDDTHQAPVPAPLKLAMRSGHQQCL